MRPISKKVRNKKGWNRIWGIDYIILLSAISNHATKSSPHPNHH